MLADSFIIASFMQPEVIGVNPQSMLWLLPLVAAISIVYKTTKVHTIRFFSFVKDVILLFGSIVIFMTITAVILYALAWFLLK
jgi:hypothetical protein